MEKVYTSIVVKAVVSVCFKFHWILCEVGQDKKKKNYLPVMCIWTGVKIG